MISCRKNDTRRDGKRREGGGRGWLLRRQDKKNFSSLADPHPFQVGVRDARGRGGRRQLDALSAHPVPHRFATGALLPPRDLVHVRLYLVEVPEHPRKDARLIDPKCKVGLSERRFVRDPVDDYLEPRTSAKRIEETPTPVRKVREVGLMHVGPLSGGLRRAHDIVLLAPVDARPIERAQRHGTGLLYER